MILKYLNHQIDIKTIRRYCKEYIETLKKGGKEEKLIGKQIMGKADIFELLRNWRFTDINYQSVCKYVMSYSLGNENSKPKP